MPYMAFISTQGLLFIHAADLHWRSCTEGADWSPVCSHDWGHQWRMQNFSYKISQQMGLMFVFKLQKTHWL